MIDLVNRRWALLHHWSSDLQSRKNQLQPCNFSFFRSCRKFLSFHFNIFIRSSGLDESLIPTCMKNIIIVLIITFATSPVSAQDKNLSFGIELNPVFNIPIVEKQENFEFTNQIGASISGLLNLKLNSFYSIRSGINFSFLRFVEKDFSLSFGCDNISGEFSPNNSWLENEYSLYYVGIPIKNIFKLNKKKNHFYLQVGGSLLVNIGSTNEVRILECGIDTGLDVQGFDIEPMPFIIYTGIGLGYEFSTNKNSTFFVESNALYSINRLLNDTNTFSPGLRFPPKMKSLNLGLSMGLNF